MLGINLARLEKSVRCVSTLRKEHLQVLPHVSEYPDWKCLYAGYQSREIGKVCTLCISLAKRTTDLFKSFLTNQSTQTGNVCMLGINLVRLEKSVCCVSALQKELLTSSSPSSRIRVPRVLSFQPAVFSPFLGPMPILLNSMRGLLFPLISIMLQQKPKL